MLYSKLAFKNVGKSLRDYMIYFITLAFGVCIFYSFNSLNSQTLVQALGSSKMDILEIMMQMIHFASYFVLAILGFLILYANKYLLRRRKKELGIYLLLGMPKGAVAFILAVETALIGIFALAVGLIIGIFLSQGLSVLTAQMFEIRLDMFHFVFSPSAFNQTILSFAVVFLLVMFFNIVLISKCSLISLLHAEHKNETVWFRRLWISVCLFVLAVACLGFAYQQIIQNGLGILGDQFTRALLFGILGTLLLFMSFSGFMLRLAQSNKKRYYKGLNMFVFRQLHSKLNLNFLSMTFVCLMLFFAIAVTATATGINATMTQQVKERMPFDATVKFMKITDKEQANRELARGGLEQSEYFGKICLYSYLETGIPFSEYLTNEDFDDFHMSADVNERTFDAMSLSDYNQLLAMQGMSPLKLGEDECTVFANSKGMAGAAQKLSGDHVQFRIGGQVLKATGRLLTNSFETTTSSRVQIVLVLPDTAAQTLKPYATFMAGNYPPGQEESTEQKLAQTTFTGNFTVMTAETVYILMTGSKVSMLYILLYIGVVFLLAASAVLALQQLSETADNIERYGLLRKLGADEKMARKALFSQIALYFVIPLALALVHSVVAIYVVYGTVTGLGMANPLASILFSAVLLLVLYGIYFLATYLGSKNILKERAQ